MLDVDLIRRTLGQASDERWSWLRRGHRSIRVDVFVKEEAVDSFVVGDGDDLRRALEPVLRHLPVGQGYVRLTGVEERRLPLGLRVRRLDLTLGNQLQALAFLDAAAGPAA
jgi:hypothetical protein